MEKSPVTLPRPFSSLPSPLKVSGAARKELEGRLEKVLAKPRAKDAFDRLTKKSRDPAFRPWLECYLTDPVEPEQAAGSADVRKMDRNLARAFLASLRKAQRLMVRFSEFSGEPFARLSHGLAEAFERVRPWRERPRPALLFTRRQYQQFRLLERIRQSSGRWRLREAADLLSTIYTVQNITGEHPTEQSLSYLVRRFQSNQARWRKARGKQQKIR